MRLDGDVFGCVWTHFGHVIGTKTAECSKFHSDQFGRLWMHFRVISRTRDFTSKRVVSVDSHIDSEQLLRYILFISSSGSDSTWRSLPKVHEVYKRGYECRHLSVRHRY